jgi:uncharacterized protein (TIGR03435 family)
MMSCMRPAILVNTAYVEYGDRRDPDPLHAWPAFGGALFNGLATEPQKVRGGPAWAYSDRYTIEAKAEGTVEQAVMLGPMLRALLEERFQLKVHRDVEDVPMYALTVAKGGLKIKPMAPGGCIAREPGKAPTPEAMAAGQAAGLPLCGWWRGAEHGPNRIWDFGGQDISQVAVALSTDLNRHVIDRTGITGKFNLHFEYLLDDTTPGSRPRPVRDVATDIPPAASVFAALEQQLGLKLEPFRGPRGFVVIDRLERPSPDLPAALLMRPARARGAGVTSETIGRKLAP